MLAAHVFNQAGKLFFLVLGALATRGLFGVDTLEQCQELFACLRAIDDGDRFEQNVPLDGLGFKGLTYVPRVIITDKLKSYSAAKRESLPGVEHRQSRYLNNRCENSHRPTRQRERRMQGFKSAGHAQRFLPAYGPITQHFRPRRHLLSASDYRQEMRKRFESWAAITGTEWAA
jgi:hypothetical protein